MSLREIEPAAGLQHSGRSPRPMRPRSGSQLIAPQLVNDEIVAATDQRRRVIDVALDEARIDPGARGKRPRMADGLDADESSPVATAPRRARQSVSRPMWHCR